ncbi:MAG TPA: 3-hydroxyacyl-CoA dehydrogenase NAD-binding domain-containing protein [Candidatus Lokiarchaeia archaeon]|nr:3-hydroxyacyl-CoA dehydrogenase NAD-binding domain-containing protein [Candidatus Lokiarchaeia archaeon]
MDLSKIDCIGVIGAGEMGHGIAECCALAGYTVFLKDIKAEILDKARDRISQSLESLGRKHRIKEDQIPVIRDRVQYCLDYAEFSKLPLFCIETVPEIESLKKKVYQELDEILDKKAIIATNTSTISITELATASNHPDQFIGMHFFIPPVIMDPVEVINGDQTSEETVEVTRQLTEAIGKIPIMVLKDVPGFMINRVQAPSSILICKAIELGIATPNQVDAMSHKMGLPMGPFEIMDLQGLDTVKHATTYLSEKLGQEFELPAWFSDLVENGCLGRKSGKGIFDYSSGHANIDPDDLPDPEKLKLMDLIVVQINEACKLIEDGVIEGPADVDIAIKTGTGNRSGIFGLLAADRQGVIDRLDQLADLYQMEMFRPIELLKTIVVPNIDKILKERKKLVKKVGNY